jgi:hypothetical protein
MRFLIVLILVVLGLSLVLPRLVPPSDRRRRQPVRRVPTPDASAVGQDVKPVESNRADNRKRDGANPGRAKAAKPASRRKRPIAAASTLKSISQKE